MLLSKLGHVVILVLVDINKRLGLVTMTTDTDTHFQQCQHTYIIPAKGIYNPIPLVDYFPPRSCCNFYKVLALVAMDTIQ